MNNKINIPIAALAAMAALTGCDDNAWNDRLDGFDSNPAIEQKESADYTLVAADYKNIASDATNKAMAEEAGAAAELAAVGSKACFNDKVTAREYIPAWLNSAKNPYLTLSDGSALRLTYKVETGLPECVYASAAAHLFTVTDDDYMQVWGSNEDYVDAFAPSHPASKFLAPIVADYYDDAEAGEYVIVTYNESAQEPVFGGGGQVTPTPPFELSNVIGTLKADENVTINGVLSGACGSGFTLTDASGTIFVYMGSFDPATYPVGTQLTVTGTSTSFKGNLQIASGADVEAVGTQDFTYPAPVVYTPATLDAELERPSDVPAVYCQMTGKVAVSGNNINIVLSDDATAKGSVYYATEAQKALLTDGETVTVTGWFISISGGKYCNVVVNTIEKGSASVASRRARTVRAAASVPSQTVNAVYYYDGSTWSVPSDFDVLSPSDYRAMGQKYDNLTAPLEYLPAYLRVNHPYAQADETRYVLCKVYASGETSYACYSFTFNGSEWVNNNGVTEETSQFVRTGGKWIYDPNVTITLPAGKGQELSTLYFQTCVDWVYENKCVPLGDTSITSGKFWVTSYGNNEYYSGTSAYQGNVDLRPGSARSQYTEGWGDLTNEQIVETMKHRFTHEVFPAALSKLHPDATPIDGLDLLYFINFSAYNGSATTQYTVTYKVVAPATFEFVSCTWDEPAE